MLAFISAHFIISYVICFHRLSQCNIEEKGCSCLASALQQNSGSLKVLDLSINMVGDKGAKELYIKCDISQLTKLE